MVVNTNTVADGLDLEWMELMMEAKELGISKESIRDFLNQGESFEIFMERL